MVTRRVRHFKGAWNPERRRLRMTKEQGTLPSLSSSATLAPGGAMHGLVAASVLLVAFVSFTRFVSRL